METNTMPNALEPLESHVEDYKKSETHIEEVAVARITDERLWELSQESLQFKSKTTVRIGLMMFVQGCIMAGYGIDWAVISGINAFSEWVWGKVACSEDIKLRCISTIISALVMPGSFMVQ